MSSFARIPTLVELSTAERCTFIGVAESHEADKRCLFTAYLLHPASGHCSRHLTDEEVATVLPRIKAWKLGVEDLLLAVTTMTSVSVADVNIYIEVTEGG